jgi:hypothetical protein
VAVPTAGAQGVAEAGEVADLTGSSVGPVVPLTRHPQGSTDAGAERDTERVAGTGDRTGAHFAAQGRVHVVVEQGRRIEGVT